MKANNLESGTMNTNFETQPTAGLKARFGVRKGLWAALALVLVLAGTNRLNQSTVRDNGDMMCPPLVIGQAVSLKDGYFRSGQWKADLLTLAAAVRFLVTA
jgi:hypothetical protein